MGDNWLGRVGSRVVATVVVDELLRLRWAVRGAGAGAERRGWEVGGAARIVAAAGRGDGVGEEGRVREEEWRVWHGEEEGARDRTRPISVP